MTDKKIIIVSKERHSIGGIELVVDSVGSKTPSSTSNFEGRIKDYTIPLSGSYTLPKKEVNPKSIEPRKFYEF